MRLATLIAVLIVLVAVLLAGCVTTQDFMERHPRASALIAASVVTSRRSMVLDKLVEAAS